MRPDMANDTDKPHNAHEKIEKNIGLMAVLIVIPFTILWEVINRTNPRLSTLLLGVCFLLIVYFIPHGVVGVIEDIRKGRNPLTPAREVLDSMLRRKRHNV